MKVKYDLVAVKSRLRSTGQLQNLIAPSVSDRALQVKLLDEFKQKDQDCNEEIKKLEEQHSQMQLAFEASQSGLLQKINELKQQLETEEAKFKEDSTELNTLVTTKKAKLEEVKTNIVETEKSIVRLDETIATLTEDVKAENAKDSALKEELEKELNELDNELEVINRAMQPNLSPKRMRYLEEMEAKLEEESDSEDETEEPTEEVKPSEVEEAEATEEIKPTEETEPVQLPAWDPRVPRKQAWMFGATAAHKQAMVDAQTEEAEESEEEAAPVQSPRIFGATAARKQAMVDAINSTYTGKDVSRHHPCKGGKDVSHQKERLENLPAIEDEEYEEAEEMDEEVDSNEMFADDEVDLAIAQTAVIPSKFAAHQQRISRLPFSPMRMTPETIALSNGNVLCYQINRDNMKRTQVWITDTFTLDFMKKKMEKLGERACHPNNPVSINIVVETPADAKHKGPDVVKHCFLCEEALVYKEPVSSVLAKACIFKNPKGTQYSSTKKCGHHMHPACGAFFISNSSAELDSDGKMLCELCGPKKKKI